MTAALTRPDLIRRANSRQRVLIYGLSVGVAILAAGCASPKKLGKSLKSATTTTKNLFHSTVVATIKSPFTATKTGVITLSDRLHTMVIGKGRLDKRAFSLDDRPLTHAGGEDFERLLDQQNFPPRILGSVQLYVDGEEFFTPYLRAIQEAKTSIDVQTFIFDTDDYAVKVADALKARSREIPVRVYYDGLGSDQAANTEDDLPPGYVPPKDIGSYLKKDSSVLLRRTSNPYFMADHTKLHLIDGRTVFMGGMNIGRHYRYDWHDMMSRIEGPAVQWLVDAFERRWRGDAWWHRLERRKAPPTPGQNSPTTNPADYQQLRFLLTDARNVNRDILKATLLAIRCSSRRVWIETPYFSDDQVRDELVDALKRGVDVRIVIPGKNKPSIMEGANSADLGKLVELGAKVYLYPKMTHLKATLCDDWATYGSANYDTLSLRMNLELNVATSDPRIVSALARRVFEKDFRDSRRLTAAEAKAEGGPFIEFLGDQL